MPAILRAQRPDRIPGQHRLLMVRVLVTMLALAAALAAPVVAEARNRTNEELRRSIFGNYSDSEMQRFVRWFENTDYEPAPGVFVSIGGYAIRADGRDQTFFTVQIYNTTSHGFCLQLRQIMASGPLVGRNRVDNSGFNTFADPGGRTTVATYVAPTVFSGNVDFRFDGLAWLPVSGGQSNPVCGKPPELAVLMTKAIGTYNIQFLPDLRAKLEGRPPPPPYVPGNTRAALALADDLRRAGVAFDNSGRSMALDDIGQNAWGPLEVTGAYFGRLNDFRLLTWLHNGSNLDLCVVAKAGIANRLKGNVQRNLPPANGFFLGAGSGRALASFRGDDLDTSGANPIDPNDPLEFNPAVSVWDAPPGARSDAACAASAGAAPAAQALRNGGLSASGRIAELLR
jgi:hypothetical protein